MASKRIAIIGAGASGLTAIKACLEENLTPVCFEKTDDIGGLWNFREKIDNDLACVMKTTVINTSKEMMSYSDFPIPDDYPNFCHNTKVQEYFRLYADKFDLLKYIKFEHEILSVKKRPDFAKTGQWAIKIKDLKSSDAEVEEVFDAIYLCTGHHSYKYEPKFREQEKFQVRIYFTKMLRYLQFYCAYRHLRRNFHGGCQVKSGSESGGATKHFSTPCKLFGVPPHPPFPGPCVLI